MHECLHCKSVWFRFSSQLLTVKFSVSRYASTGHAWDFFWRHWEPGDLKCEEPDPDPRFYQNFQKSLNWSQRFFQMEQTCWNWDQRLRFYWKLRTRQVWFKLVLCGSLFFFLFSPREPSVKVSVHLSNNGRSLIVRFMFLTGDRSSSG